MARIIELSWAPLLAASVLAAGASACGDDGACPSEVVISFAAPLSGSTITRDESSAPGMQVTIRARSNLSEGSSFTLTVTTSNSQVAEYFAIADTNGDLVFSEITLPSGNLTLDISSVGDCAGGSETINVTVVGETACVLTIREDPIPSDFYGVPVLNTTNDSDTTGALPNFQANIDVATLAGASVEVFVTDIAAGGAEMSAGIMPADGGTASFPFSLAQGRQSVRATCVLGANFSAASATQTVYVDTKTPTCSLDPASGAIIPAMDESPPIDDGIQLTIAGTADPGAAADVQGESATITIGGIAQTTPDVDDAGDTSVLATFAAAATGIAISFSARDHAGNTCLVETTYDVDMDADTPGALNAIANTRQSILLSWIAPGIGGQAVDSYIVKLAAVVITEANFDSIGSSATPPSPGSPGAPETMQINGLRAGTAYYVAVAAGDGAGGRSTAAIAGPIVPGFDKTLVIEPDPVTGGQLFGKSLAVGYLNADSYPDLVVGAPEESSMNGAVYVFLGRATGYPTTADFKITGVGSFGTSVAVMDWNETGPGDLIVGAPWANPATATTADGEIRIFYGGTAFDIGGTPPAAHTDSDVVIGVDNSLGAATNWFQESGLGYSLATGAFGAGGSPRLIATAWVGGFGLGGAVVLTPNVGGSNVLLTDNAGGAGNASALLLENPSGVAAYDLFGLYITNVGATEGVGDTDDDFAIVSFCPQEVYVIRGGLSAPSPGQAQALLYNASTDLHLTDVSPETCGAAADPYFGFSIGSIGVTGGRHLVIGSFKNGVTDFGRIVIGTGAATGTHAITDAAFYRATIDGTAPSAGPGGNFFGMAIVNNATALNAPDVDNDGIEDLVIIGGTMVGRARAYVFFGGSAFTDTDNTSSPYFVREDLFYQWELPAADTPSTAIWCGDSPGTGLEAICWADASRRRANEYDGSLVILWDDNM